jgi:hypothetical protein
MSAPEDLPDDISGFLDRCIDSVEQLRVLLLLHSQPTRVWTISELTAELRSSSPSIEKRLQGLYTGKVLRQNGNSKGTHVYSPFSETIGSLIDRLALENQVRPYRVIEAIYSGPSKAMQAFADAFKLGGDKK